MDDYVDIEDDYSNDGADILDQSQRHEPDQRAQIEKEILFQVQGCGSFKSVGGIDVFVKSQYCEDSIRELIKHRKNDNNTEPIVW